MAYSLHAGAENVSVAMISNDTTLTLGETALLTCIGYAIPLLEMSWMHNGHTVTNSSTSTIVEADILLSNARFRQLSLKICGVGPTDSGTYTCTVTNTQIDIDASTELTVSGKYSLGI